MRDVSKPASARWFAIVCVAACTLLAVALDEGFQVGRENHAGMLPVVRRLLDPGYLPGDFGISIRAHHHRIFAWLVAALSVPLGEARALAVLTLAGYAAIFTGLWRLGAALDLGPARRALLCVALATGFAFLDHGVEANRFLGNGPIMPPTFAHALIVFGIEALVRRRWNLAFALAGATALLHLQIGGVWMAVLAVCALQSGIWREPRAWVPGLLAGVAVASPALLDLVALMREGLTQGIGAMDDVAFRMPQHFEFHGNRVAVVALYFALFAWLWRRWRARGDARAMRFRMPLVVATTLGGFVLLHYLDYYALHLGWIARAQLLRLSVFVPVLAALAVLAAFPLRGDRERWPLLVAALFAVVALGASFAKGEPPSLRIENQALAADDWADVCRWIRRNGPPGLYATPPGQTGFTAFSDRSTLVEFKINPDGGAGLAEWKRRLRAISGGALPHGWSRNDAAERLNAAYARLSPADFTALMRSDRVRTAIVPLASAVHGRELYRNATYRVVALGN